MAENKKSFILYSDFREVFNELSDQDAGQLIKHIFQYVNDENPETKNPIVKISFIPIKLALKRDLKKWDGYIEKQRVNGAKGGRPKETQITQALNGKPKKADSVNVSVSVNDIVNENVRGRENTAPPQKFRIEECLTVAMNDERWVKANKATQGELQNFNHYLERLGTYEKNPADYKQYFAKVKGKYPELLIKELTIDELRQIAKEMDKQNSLS